MQYNFILPDSSRKINTTYPLLLKMVKIKKRCIWMYCNICHKMDWEQLNIWLPKQEHWFTASEKPLWSRQCWQLLKEVERYPGTRITTSTVLPHLVAPLHVIMSKNTDLWKGRALIHNRPAVLHKIVHIHHREEDVHAREKVPSRWRISSYQATQHEDVWIKRMIY